MPRALLYTIAWNNPYTHPPDGRPRVLGQVIAAPGSVPLLPSAFGSGYGFHFITGMTDGRREDDKPRRTFTPERRAALRVRNLERRVQRQAPLFAQDIVAATLAERPAYYRGEYEDAHDKETKR